MFPFKFKSPEPVILAAEMSFIIRSPDPEKSPDAE